MSSMESLPTYAGAEELDLKQLRPELKVARLVVATQNEDYFNDLTANEQIAFGD